ncbi:MAG: prepilin-type N-terminal cleavage/methylation domain-containing protein [Verrucomicrobiae bacterium]|nr:prepilin-type N-terminal cleavage/methylation domain-containing protein [Verrucomicrobiae bacterium]NNJ86970.1 prepilin-type N-terminal cleavage/methylation domain-containing protein [Akkermansiaceae bacterium]
MQSGASHIRAKQAGGFTLLEVVFVLAMIAILVTWLTLNVTTVETEQKLREASGNIESLAKRARNIAVRQQRAYQLTISADNLSIAPEYVSLPDDDEVQTDVDGEPMVRENFDDVTASEETDKEITYEIRRWRSDEWELIEGDKKVVITLDPIGLVEPISIRCSVGKSWLMQELHPLTAGIRYEEMSVEDD